MPTRCDATIRLAVLADAAGIAAVHVRTWQVAYRGLMPDDFLDQLDVVARTERWRKNLSGFGGAPPVRSVRYRLTLA